MAITLFDHQAKAVEELSTGKILCGGVGTGKSITAIAYYFTKVCGGSIADKDYKPMTEPRDLYIITTARKRDTLEWERELAPFLLSTDPETCYYKDICIKVDSWNNIKKYINVSGAFFILDEDKIIGNGAWVKAFYKIAAKNDWIVLTATPGDTWLDYVPIFIANGFYKNRTEFQNRHVIYSRYSKYPRVDRYVEEGRLLRLRSRILVQMKFEKNTITHNINVPVTYDKVLYSTVMKQRWNVYEGNPIKNVSEFCFVLRRITNSDESRGQAVLDILEEHPNAIIFYNYDYELEILRNLPYKAGTKVAEWNGHNHDPIPRAWSHGGLVREPFVYLVNYIAGAEGWNCIDTDTMIFYSLNYSYKTMIQAAGRTDRLNTPFTDLYYYRLVSYSPIDVGVSRALKRKQKFNEKKFIGE